MVYPHIFLQYLLATKCAIHQGLLLHRELYLFSEDGIKFVFGSLADMNGPWGMVFAVRVLPIIIFFGALMSLLFHLRIVQKVVNCASYVVRPLLGTSGAETVCAISNSFFICLKLFISIKGLCRFFYNRQY